MYTRNTKPHFSALDKAPLMPAERVGSTSCNNFFYCATEKHNSCVYALNIIEILPFVLNICNVEVSSILNSRNISVQDI